LDSTSIELPGSEIDLIRLDGDRLRVHFSRAVIIKTMTGSVERTQWWQRGELIIGGAEVEGEIPAGPLVLAGGDVGENVYTYRDMIPVPLDSRGRAHCDFRFGDGSQRLRAQGDSIRLEMEATPKYIRHIRPGDSE
jgi:hypothetical protein